MVEQVLVFIYVISWMQHQLGLLSAWPAGPCSSCGLILSCLFNSFPSSITPSLSSVRDAQSLRCLCSCGTEQSNLVEMWSIPGESERGSQHIQWSWQDLPAWTRMHSFAHFHTHVGQEVKERNGNRYLTSRQGSFHGLLFLEADLLLKHTSILDFTLLALSSVWGQLSHSFDKLSFT